MHAFDVLGDPVRRRILELLAMDARTAGDVVDVIGAEFGISQSAVSQHLRVLREHGFAAATSKGTRRHYAIDPRGFQQANAWMTPFKQFWTAKLSALDTEVRRGKRKRR